MASIGPKVTTKKLGSFARHLVFGLGVVLVPARALAQQPAAAPPAPPPPAAVQEAPVPAPLPPPAAPLAQPADLPPPAPAPVPSTKGIGGHIGIATPLFGFDHPNTHIGKNSTYNIANPIGVTVKMNDKLAIDFEVIVATHIHQNSAPTSLTIDPGVVYNWGPVATGLRAKWDINSPPNFGIIPLINRGLVDFGGATWFIEAAFPITRVNDNVNLDIVFHTGIGF